MSLFNWFYCNTKHSAAYTKLSRILARTPDHIRMQSAYYLFCVQRTAENLEKLKNAIYNAEALEQLRKQSQYDPDFDSIDLYFVIDEQDNSYFVFVLDPHNLSRSQKLVDVIRFNRKISFYGKLLS
jgi:hypothetical protein